MRKPSIRKRLISAHHDYQLYAVDATALRSSAEGNEEFGNFATHDEFDYDKAHEICSKVEFDLRWRRRVEDFLGSRRHKLAKGDVPKLTSPEFFRFVLKEYVT